MLVEAEIWTVARTDQGNAVLVRPIGSETAVPIFIGQLEAQSIIIGIGNVPMPRPLTHDLLLNVLREVNSTIIRIEITSLVEGTFYAQLILDIGTSEIIVDSRPSDSIALAVREKCPIYIDESVVDEAGIAIKAITDENANLTKVSHTLTERQKLEKLLDEVVADENYEEAAKIRDKLEELDLENPNG